MKKFILSFLFLALLVSCTYAQDKKVAVVTFYVAKQIEVPGYAPGSIGTAMAKLADDPKFDMGPLLKNFHDQFFESYAASFPFRILPEEEVTRNEAYKDFAPENAGFNDILNGNSYLAAKGYKVILPLKGGANEKKLLALFDQCDGIMKVYLNFDMEAKSFGNLSLVKINAHANIVIFNKNGDKIFSLKKDAMSKKSGARVAGIPFMTPEKILPLCESAADELMLALQQDLPKMAKKADRKL
ncbi:hypothetical protein [Mucilaginibacter xinganensis]|uniref:Lipoprotein n=1 Tax=Mucilaginibacter xinganensis TaxID=1234841 RepID=A0A223NUG6_9SPHI|nr:hypothetical protein [Mucilaginibacter xinganensis]ASU33539.1 hypothetical protein MuYL_1641 [Mucilaginibacter xinganensis]